LSSPLSMTPRARAHLAVFLSIFRQKHKEATGHETAE
jgi:hypothetical protein